MLAKGTPYIVGFPGKTYREFDLSGEWRAPNTTATTPAQLDPQIITFASETGESIVKSDTQTGVDMNSGYTFKPNYLSKVVTGTSYQMAAAGNKFDQQTNATPVPFRPYFIAGSPSSPAPATRAAKYIVFDNNGSSFAIGDDDPSEGEVGQGSLLFGVGRRKIVVTSSLRDEADVRIVNVNGQTIDAYTIQPGETVETNVNSSGVYIIRAAGGHYTKKVSVKW